MSAVDFQSDTRASNAALAHALAGVRADVEVSIACSARDRRTRLASLTERGGYRAKFPHQHGRMLEAVIVNSGGGVAGGDSVKLSASADVDARLTVSTATAERIYRSLGPATTIDVRLTAAAGATLAWLPQPTILFSGARLDRRFEVDLAADARLILAETFVFGRIASGEIMGDGAVHDRWRLRRDGRLAFAETTRIDGNLASLLDRATVAGAARAMALIVIAAPDAEDMRDPVREALSACGADHGVSTRNGLLVIRALASGLDAVHDVTRRAVEVAMDGSVPRAWAG